MTGAAPQNQAAILDLKAPLLERAFQVLSLQPLVNMLTTH